MADGVSPTILPPMEGAPPSLMCRVQQPDGAIGYAYRYERPGVAATVVVRHPSKDLFLLIRRGIEPYLGQLSLPGGFVEAGRETIEETAIREVLEESGIHLDPGSICLVDVRSEPSRDPRDHVLDIGFYAEALEGNGFSEGEALQRSQGETREIVWATPDEIDGMTLPFDHDVLWRRARILWDTPRST
jgi:ADP-ribose pyrophosphatase YjhB (NUDIX family)